MKQAVLVLTTLAFSLAGFSQEKKKLDIRNRSNDHVMMQFGWHGWAKAPDSLNIRGYSRTFNFYIMMDFPFKTNPQFSVALGPGIATDHLFFNKTNITIATNHSGPLRFQNVSDTNHFDKYKLSSAYLELPVELRFSSNPATPGKSFKAALGLKVGLLTDVHTKGKQFVARNGNTVSGYDEKFVQKQKDKFYFNGNRLAATARLGYGHFSLFGSYQLSSFIKEGLGPDVKPVSIGLTLSGL